MKLLKNSNIRFWLIQVGLAIGLIGILIFGLLKFLNVWTRHDQFILVPNLSQKTLAEVQLILEKQNLRYEVLDSATYNPKFPKFSVISQSPLPNEKVKKNRKIYLTLNPSSYQKVSVPRVIQITRRSAEATIKAVGLVVGKVTYVDDIGKDMVLKVTYKGKEVQAGDLLAKTSVIDLECGNGIDPTLPIEMQIESTTQQEGNSVEDAGI